jgi:hyperosmotically inducible periplasmic protein
MKTKLVIMTLSLSALALAGCESTTPNSNTAATRPNSNQAVVVNSNTNVVVANTSNTNRWRNANVNRADYDKDRAEYEKDKRSGETIGSGVNDSWLWTKTRLALMTTNDLRESTIDVDVVNEVVTLKGTVATKEQSAKAAQVAKDIDGVKSVNNQLKVAPNDSMTNTGGSKDGTKANTANKPK